MLTKWHQLISLRKGAGLSQYELARHLKISRSRLGNYEMGEREPDFETVKKIATFFGVSVDHLLGQKDAPSGETDIPDEWLAIIRQAREQGYSPDQVLQALRLLDSVRKQQEQNTKGEREG